MNGLSRTKSEIKMNRLHYFNVAIIFIACQIMGCSKQIESGNFLGIEVGESKARVLEALVKNQDISQVTVNILNFKEITSKNIADLEGLLQEPGIVIEGPGFFSRFGLDDGKVSRVYNAPINKSKSLKIVTGDPGEKLISTLKEVLVKNKRFKAYAVPKDNRWIELSLLKKEDTEYLFSYDVWLFHEDSKYSTTRMFFHDGKLEKIYYRYSPIELP